MKNQVQVFENKEFGKLEVLMLDGKLYFPAAECARILGYKDTINAIKQHCRGVVKHHLTDALGRKQQANFIPEGDLYRLIIRSKLPAAEKFEAWVCDDVLPSVRKYGAYITDGKMDELLTNPASAAKLFDLLKAEREKKEALQGFVERIAPKAYYCDVITHCENTIPVSVIAKDYGMTAVSFNKLLNGLGVQYSVGGTWVLYSKYSNNGYTVTRTYHVSEKTATISTYWTQKGRYFIYEILKYFGVLPEVEKGGRLCPT